MPRSPSIALMVSCLTRAFRKRRAGLCRWHPGDSSTNTGTLVGADARHTCRISAPSVPLTVRRPGGSGGLFDPESLHQRLQRRTLHAEPRGRTPRASQHPVRLFEGTQDIGALDGPARRAMVADRRGFPTPREVVERHLERPAAGKDHRALDEVRELSDVPGPSVPTQRVQRLARDDLHPAVHGTREPLDEVAHQGRNVLGPLSGRPDGIAAQLSFTNVRSRRWLRSWMARASSSLPVPVSPRSRTVESVGATISTCWSVRFSAGLSPTMCSNDCSLRISLSRYRRSSASLSLSRAISRNAMAFSIATATSFATSPMNWTSASVYVAWSRRANPSVPSRV